MGTSYTNSVLFPYLILKKFEKKGDKSGTYFE